MPFSGPVRASPRRSEFRRFDLAVSVPTGFASVAALRSIATALADLRSVALQRRCDQYLGSKTPGQGVFMNTRRCPPEVPVHAQETPMSSPVGLWFSTGCAPRRPLTATGRPSSTDVIQLRSALLGKRVVDELAKIRLHRCTHLQPLGTAVGRDHFDIDMPFTELHPRTVSRKRAARRETEPSEKPAGLRSTSRPCTTAPSNQHALSTSPRSATARPTPTRARSAHRV